jgi:enoyl-CoA hydratase/carnithine racemase
VTSSDVDYRVADGVARVTIRRPQARNALSREMYSALRDAFRAVRVNDSVYALVLSGSDGAFAVGGDLKEMSELLAAEDRARILGYEDDLPFEALRQLPKPTIAAIDGLCMGGGLTLALMCDIRIATTRSTFAIPEARVGIVDGHLPRLLRERVPSGVLRRWLFTGSPFPPAEAFRAGLLSELVDADDLTKSVDGVLDELRGVSPRAVAKLKSIQNETFTLPSMTDAYDSLLSEDVREHLLSFANRSRQRSTPHPPAAKGQPE